MTRPCITLLTDFGLSDSYVGQMKGVIAAINPEAIVVDLTHSIPPQQILAAAIALSDAVEAFPAGTIHVVVVDPGVGSARRAIATEIGSQRFVCPDNGLLSLILSRESLKRAVELDQPQWWRSAVSSTFHGRDLFAPVAAAWSLGRDLSELGTPISVLVDLQIPEPTIRTFFAPATGEVRGEVLMVDHFGNLITNVSRKMLPTATSVIDITFRDLAPRITRCYADARPGEIVALFGSSQRLELAVVNGNAARQLGVGQGEPVVVRWKEVAQ